MVASAEDIPLSDNSIGGYSIAFGIRNVTNIDQALQEAYRVLKPNSKITILEFSQVDSMLLKQLYKQYSFHIIPRLGGLIVEDTDSYQYFVESIEKFDTAEVLKTRLEKAGFQQVRYQKLSFGIVAIHTGYKYA